MKLTCVVRLKLFILLCEWNISSLHTERNRKISATKYSVNNFPTFTPNLSISHFAPLSQSYKGMSSTASEDAPCGGCQALVCGGDEALECDICGLWDHIACSGSSEQCCELITGCEGLTWICPTCRAAIRFASTKVRELDSVNVALRLELTELHNEVKLLRRSPVPNQNTDVLEPTVALPMTPEQDSSHAIPSIRGSASCPILDDNRKTDVVAEESSDPPASNNLTSHINLTTAILTSNQTNHKTRSPTCLRSDIFGTFQER